jgi:phage gpG-like protein
MATLEFNGAAEVNQYIDSIQDRLLNADYTPLLRSLQQYLEQEHARFIAMQAGPGGEPWKQLAESTVNRKGHAIILVDKTDLAQSIAGPGHKDAIREIVNEGSNHGLSFGTRVPYSKFHQHGTKKLPIRMHVGANQKMVDEMSAQLRAFAIAVLVRGDAM